MKYLKERMWVRYWEFGRRMTGIIFGPSERVIEYSFVLRNLSQNRSYRILEVGASCSPLSYKLAQSGYNVYAVDVRPYPFVHDKLRAFQGDIIKMSLPKGFFDYAIMVSTIEHIGMGAYGDPIYPNGDFLVINKLIDAIKDTGRILVTTHFVPHYHEKHSVRYYDDVRLNKLAGDMLSIEKEEYYIATKKWWRYSLNWIRTTKEIAMIEDYPSTCPHALVCLVLRKKGNY